MDGSKGNGFYAMRKRSEIDQPTPSMAEMDQAMRESEAESEKPKPRTGTALPEAALARFIDFHPGDHLTITIGQELYSPIKYATFTVGPFAATVVVRPNETGAQAAMRCYRILLELNEAEFQIAWSRHLERATTVKHRKD